MTTERILYTDGHDVTVTESTFRVRKHFYRLDGITRHSFSIIKPSKLPGIFITGLGVLAIAVGISGTSLNSDFALSIFSMTVGPNVLFSIGGCLLILLGSLLMGLMKERYSVRIVTAEGEKHVLVSDRREYISMVIEALNKAFLNMLRKTGRDEKRVEPPLGMSVSSR
jgi:hypothetical protein